MELVVHVYDMTRFFPREELYGLTNQIRRAAVSIPSNISEGAARHSEKEFVQYLHIALGSAAELETQLIIAKKLNYIADDNNVHDEITLVMKMINGLIRHYKNKTVARRLDSGERA